MLSAFEDISVSQVPKFQAVNIDFLEMYGVVETPTSFFSTLSLNSRKALAGQSHHK